MPHARPALPKALLFGVYSGIVIDVKDPDAQGRVKVSLPWAEGGDAGRYETWARLAVPMAGNNRGTWLIPDVDDEVLVAFVAGDGSQFWQPVMRSADFLRVKISNNLVSTPFEHERC